MLCNVGELIVSNYVAVSINNRLQDITAANKTVLYTAEAYAAV